MKGVIAAYARCVDFLRICAERAAGRAARQRWVRRRIARFRECGGTGKQSEDRARFAIPSGLDDALPTGIGLQAVLQAISLGGEHYFLHHAARICRSHL